MRRAAIVLGSLAVVAGCESKPQPPGIGRYNVKKLTLADATGRCEPTDLPDGRKGTWCYLEPQVTIAKQTADVDLYFGGTTPDAKVVEVQFKVRGCHEDDLSLWLRKFFGEPIDERSTRAVWQNANVSVLGELPSEPGRCLVRLLPRSEDAELERLRKR